MKKNLLLLAVIANCLLPAANCFSQVAWDGNGPDIFTDGGNQSAYSFTHTCSGSDRMLIVMVSNNGASSTAPTVTYNGTPMTADLICNSAAVILWWFSLVNPPAGSPYVVDVILPITSQGNIATAVSFTGVCQTGNVYTVAPSCVKRLLGSYSTVTDNVTVNNGDMAVDMFYSTWGTSPTGAGAGQTIASNIDIGANTGGMSYKPCSACASPTAMTWFNARGQWNHIYASLASSANPCILPVELLSFSGNCENNNSVKLNWATASEKNNNYFTLERGKETKEGEKIEWENIGTVKGAGNSSAIRNYTFIDQFETWNLKQETFYYRLKQTDFDGKSETFNPIAVNPCSEKIKCPLIFPNPSSGILTIKNISEEAEVQVHNIMGEKIFSVHLSEEENFFTVNLSEQQNGMYFISMNDDTKMCNQKIIIAR